MRTFAIVNRKGGVGKTTTGGRAIRHHHRQTHGPVAFILAKQPPPALMRPRPIIDADSQGNATSMMLVSATVQRWNPSNTIRTSFGARTARLDIIPIRRIWGTMSCPACWGGRPRTLTACGICWPWSRRMRITTRW